MGCPTKACFVKSESRDASVFVCVCVADCSSTNLGGRQHYVSIQRWHDFLPSAVLDFSCLHLVFVPLSAVKLSARGSMVLCLWLHELVLLPSAAGVSLACLLLLFHPKRKVSPCARS